MSFINPGKYSNNLNIALLILRIFAGGLMLVHGIPKFLMLLAGGEIQFPGVMGMSPVLSLSLAVFAEVLCSTFIMLGFLTRFALLPLLFTMLVAFFGIHGQDDWSHREASAIYAVFYIVLLITSAGKYSIDYLLFKNK